MPSYKVILDRSYPSADPRRAGKIDRLIQVRVDGGQVLTVALPAEAFTEAKLSAAVRTVLEQAQGLQDKQIPL